MSKSQAKSRVAQMRAQQAAAEKRRRTLVASLVAVVAVVAIVGAGIGIQALRDTTTADATPPAGTAAGTDGFGFLVGDPAAPALIELFEDFQCPACANFEQISGSTVHDLVSEGTARLVYRPMAFLDRASTDKYSTRSLNAFACVADATAAEQNDLDSPIVRFHDLLFANQPAEGGPGLSDDRLVDLAVQAGASESDARSCVEDREFEDWTRAVTEAASKDGVNSTPTVRVNGTVLPSPTPDALRAAVAAAS